MTPRKVQLSTKLSLLKRRPIPILIGVLFTLIPLFIVFVLSIVFSSIKKDTPKIDYELVNLQGKETFAEVTDIVTQHNITVNGIHPTTISYKFSNNGQNIESKNEVLEDKKIEKIEVGDTLKIKQLNDVSIISDFEPYEFPTNDILYFPIPFLFIGLPFLFFSFIKLNKEVELYKFGIELKGKIISMMPKSGIPISNIGQGIMVYYEYKTGLTPYILDIFT